MSARSLRHESHPSGLRPVPVSGLRAIPANGTLVAGRYRVRSELGRGGMCVVLAARDETLGRDVALKLVLPRLMLSEEIVERFGNEARSLARLDSRHVVRVLDYGVINEPAESAGLPFMVLELLEGCDLFTYAAEQGRLSPSRVVRFALEACDGLAAAHAEGIIHRDLKPENLFVAVEPEGTECLKVLDFGIARGRSARALTKDQHGVGSPGYMSPEQVSNSSDVDARSDIWALGIVMYELLANRAAFTGETAQELCWQIVNEPLPPLSELCPQLPAALVYVVERCLERDVARRFQNVAELAEALAPLDDLQPISEATRIRRRLELRGSVPPASGAKGRVEATPASGQRVRGGAWRDRPPEQQTSSGRGRKAFSFAFAALLLLPVLALLPTLLRAPQLEPARQWSSDALEVTQSAVYRAKDAAVRLWSANVGNEASDSVAP